MDRDRADQTLTGLGAAHDRIAAAMFHIDSHPGLAFLRGAGLTARTAERAAILLPEVDLLWAHFNALTELLEQARTIRDQRRLSDDDWDALRLLLTGPVLAVDSTGLPVEANSPATARTVGIADLSTGLEQRCAAMGVQLSEVDSAWSAVAAAFAPLTEACGTVAGQAEEVGAGQLVRPLVERVDRARAEHLADPLSAAPGGQPRPALQTLLRECDDELAAVRRRVGALVALRDAYPARLAAVRALLDEVSAAESRVRDAYARTAQKIADPALPPPPRSADVLRASLPGATVEKGQWQRTAEELTALEATARRAIAHAEALRAAADGLLERRGELRGRLEAYRAKAGRVGFAEDGGLSSLYQRAHDLLFTAPCDLRQSTQAVHAYQQALADLIASTKESTS